MNHLATRTTAAHPRQLDHDREGSAMLLHEALARYRQQDARAAAREHALARRATAGRGWALVARFAARRAASARADAGAAPLNDGFLPR